MAVNTLLTELCLSITLISVSICLASYPYVMFYGSSFSFGLSRWLIYL